MRSSFRLLFLSIVPLLAACAGTVGGGAVGTETAFESTATLDTTFGSGGRVSDFRDALTSSVVLPDGRIYTFETSGQMGDRVRRFLPNGTPDESFGGRSYNGDTWGVAKGDLWLGTEGAPACVERGNLAATADGGFVLAGENAGGLCVVRFDAAGRLATTFGTGGLVSIPLASTWPQGPASARRIAVSATGTIAIAGQTGVGTGLDLHTEARIYELDDTGRILRTIAPAPLSLAGVAGLAYDAHGLVVSGDSASLHESAAIGRFVSGAPDPSFGAGGFAQLKFPSRGVDCELALDAGEGGSLIACYAAGSDVPMIVRLTASGNVDTSFGTNGYATVATDFVSAFVFDDAHRPLLLVSDYASPMSLQQVPSIVRLTASGQPDTAVGLPACELPPSASERGERCSEGESLARQPDGALLVGRGVGSFGSELVRIRL